MNFNTVVLGGRLTQDPEVKYTSIGTAICTLNLAVNHRYKTAGGEQKEEACFVRCTAFGKLGEICVKYLNKGSEALISGRLKTNSWTDKEGNKRSQLEVAVEDVQFVGKKSNGSDEEPF